MRTLIKRRDLYDVLLLAFTYNTNRIEGSTLTEPETASILFDHATLPDRTLLEQMEVKNHQAAFRYMMHHLSEGKKVDMEFVFRLHAILMNAILEDAGRFRTHAVRIAGSNVPTANHLKVPALMETLMKDISHCKRDEIRFAVRVHSQFEQIHPFSDGNGRIGRLFLVAMLLELDIAPAVIQQDQRRYYIMYLNQSQAGKDFSRLEGFIYNAILKGYGLIAPGE